MVSVIIPTYNRMEMLHECVESVIRSTYKDLEVIVVDNCSTDGTVKDIKNMMLSDGRIKIVQLEQNLMAAGGRNKGIEVASGDFMLFLDNDNVIYEDMIEILVNKMESNRRIGLAGPLSINRNQDDTIWLAAGGYNFYTSRPDTVHGGVKFGSVKLDEKYKTYYSPNAMMISREAIEKVGGFDTFYYAMYEEADIGYRISRAGYEEYIFTDAKTNHLGFVGDGEEKKLRLLGIGFPERAFYFARNRSVFEKKYATWYQKVVFFVFFVHVFTVYYCVQAVIAKRWDIAKAYFMGAIKGIFYKI